MGVSDKMRLFLQTSSVKGPKTRFHTDQFQFCYPTEVCIFTTRGGKWPERRVFPNGGPGASKQELREQFGEPLDTSQMAREWVDTILQ